MYGLGDQMRADEDRIVELEKQRDWLIGLLSLFFVVFLWRGIKK